ncbi:MAG TPA: DUF2490 domain-containing protein [Bacteroidia bacterium]|jgi:hypothetical protein
MKKIILYFFLLSVTTMFGQATDAEQDAGLWTTLNLDKKLNDKFSIFYTQEFRLRENFSRINLFYSELGVEIRPAKFLKVALSYRNIQKNLIDDSYGIRHRFQLDITLRKKFGDFSLAYRHRLQRELRDMYVSETGMVPEWYSRSKFTLKYEVGKKFEPYIATEIRYQIADPRLEESDGTWHRIRYIAGFDYKLNDHSKFGMYGLVQNEFNVTTPQSIYILGLEYTYSF